MSDLPNPLTPADCDLRGYTWMPLDVVRVIDSDTFGLSTGDEFKTAFRLWAKSWLQVPAASLPDDDRLLAHLAGLSENMPKWKKVRAIALRGFVKCSDGRLYHPVIAEKAIEAMGKREARDERDENTQTRQQQHRERRKAMFEQLRQHGIVPAWDTKTAELERLVASLGSPQPVTQSVTPETQNVTGSVTGDVACDAPATANTRQDITGQDIKPENLEALSPLQPVVGPSPGDRASPVSRSIEIAVYLRQRGIVGSNSANPNIAAWGDDVRVTNEILDAALSIVASRKLEKPVGPNYLVGIITDLLNPKPVQPKREDNAWKRTPAGIERKASELGVICPPGRDHGWLLEKCEAELRNRAQVAA
ncbi:DUF1376 domain-containing protein [Burkholderia orbicola]|uniref:DUF1376 domain-containing protein n=1 Tax=Burkholderia orbicola TaxID=2978683 RepID=UPI00265513E9|nr:DUF1376 domain-containing protein [Burkholderia orbicola]MDN7481903.1 DUF1376 domain-containing protein [Burkholderia orbicola]